MVVNAIEEFIYTPTADFQLVLGTNGCGKSSLLRELSPLPGNHKMFKKGGKKEVHLSHGRHNYVCTSVFNSGTGKHSFVKDGVELNDGGTPTIQRDLVFREFKLDQEIHDLMTGKIKFTRMGINERRRIINRLSTADHTYVLGLYKRVSSASRDAIANVKQHREKILSDTNKLLAFEDVEGLEERIGEVTAELNVLFRNRIPNLPGRNQAQHEYNQSIERLEAISESILRTDLANLNIEGFKDKHEIRTHVIEMDTQLQTSIALMTNFTQQYADLESFIKALVDSGVDNVQDLKNVEQRLISEIRDAEERQQTFKGAFEPSVVSQALEVSGPFGEILRDLPDNTEGKYTKTGRQEHMQRQQDVSRQIGGLENQIASIERRETMIMEAKDSVCPKCGYIWKEGISENELDALATQRKELENRVARGNVMLTQITHYIDTVTHIEQLYGRYRMLTFTYPRLEKLWEYVTDNEVLKVSPSSHQMLIHKVLADFEAGAVIHKNQEELAHVRDAMKKIQVGESAGASHYSQRLAVMEESIAAETDKQRVVKAQLSKARAYLGRVEQAESAILEVAALVRRLDKTVQTLSDIDKVETIDAITSGHQQQLSHMQRKLTEMNTLRAIITDREKDLDSLILKQEALKVIDNQLNPKNGLIASLMIGFINSIADHLNAVIEPIWTHDLIVQPCSMEDGDLDYKFPFTVSTSTEVVADVGEGSEGQEELFNFAFMLTAMMYLELEDYPLIVDELGRTFDTRHRFNVMTFLKNVVDARTITQVFLTSHYATEYSTMASAEVLVIDGSNIVTPSVYNQHVVMR